MFVVGCLTLLRLLLPLVIFRWQLTGILVAVLTDMVDWHFFRWANLDLGGSYQRWDKAMDLSQSLLFFLYLVRSWRGTLRKNWGKGLFFLRGVGVILFELTGLRSFLFWFPNLFDSFFIFIQVGQSAFHKLIAFSHKGQVLLLILPLLGFKLVQEYAIHIVNFYPWEHEFGRVVTGGGDITRLVNSGVWFLLLLLLHILFLLLLPREKERSVLK